MTNKINMGVSAFDEPRRKSGPLLELTHDRLCDYIKMLNLDDYTAEGLIKLASTYPTQALPSFRRNINLMIQRVHAKRKIENEGEQNGNTESDTTKNNQIEIQNFENWEERVGEIEVEEINFSNEPEVKEIFDIGGFSQGDGGEIPAGESEVSSVEPESESAGDDSGPHGTQEDIPPVS